MFAHFSWISRAAQNKKGTRVAAPSGCVVPWAARASRWPQPQQLLPASAAGSGRLRSCSNPPAFVSLTHKQNKKLQRNKYARVFWWARVDIASRAAKNSPLGCFCAVFSDVAATVRIHPCSPFCKTDKTETPVPGSDTGVLGGRGWIRTTEAESSRFTVCPHWPLGNTPIFDSQSQRLPIYNTTGAMVCQCFFEEIFLQGAEVSKKSRAQGVSELIGVGDRN